eukprot:UN02689
MNYTLTLDDDVNPAILECNNRQLNHKSYVIYGNPNEGLPCADNDDKYSVGSVHPCLVDRHKCADAIYGHEKPVICGTDNSDIIFYFECDDTVFLWCLV